MTQQISEPTIKSTLLPLNNLSYNKPKDRVCHCARLLVGQSARQQQAQLWRDCSCTTVHITVIS